MIRQAGLAAAGQLEGRDDLLDVLHLVLVRDQHRVGGINHHHILESEQRDEPPIAARQGIAAVAGDHVPVVRIAIAILLRHLP